MWIFLGKIDSSPRRRDGLTRLRGPLRCGHVCLGEPEDRNRGHFGLPRRRKAMLRRACDCLRPVFMACYGLVPWPGL